MYRAGKYRSSSRSWYHPTSRRYYGYSRGAVGRARSSGYAAKRGDKQENLNVTTQGYFNFSYGTSNPPLSQVVCFCPYAGGVDPTTGTTRDATNPTYGGAVNDRTFRLKCSQYDEVRLDQMKVYVNPVVSQSMSTTPAMTISTIWDRKSSPKEVGLAVNQVYMVEGRLPTAQEVTSNEGAVKSVINMNSTRGIVRSCLAKNMQEKSYYWDSTIAYNDSASESPLTSLVLDSWTKKDGAFCPALYVVSELSQTSVFGSNFTCSYRVEYNFTFRNPKSELGDFITKENPEYVNPLSKGVSSNPVIRYLSSYAEEKRRALDLISGTRDIEEDLTRSVIVLDKEGDMEVEDDPGTS